MASPSATTTVDSPLMPRAWRPALAALWLTATTTVVAISTVTHGQADNGIDAAIAGHLRDRLAAGSGHLRLVTVLGSPGAVVSGSVALGCGCVLLHHHRAAAFALLAPGLSGGMAEWVLKPLVGRTKGLALSFPSGTTAGAFGLAVTVCVLLVATTSPTTSARVVAARVAVAAATLAAAASVAVAVVTIGWHYASDAVGGAATGVAVVIATAAIVDLAAGLRPQPRVATPALHS